MPDTLQKLDYLTMHLRGFDRRGAAAARFLQVESQLLNLVDLQISSSLPAVE